jgi:hypothetical protein
MSLNCIRIPAWASRLCAAGFLFFLVKGLLWLVLGGLVVVGVL